MRASTARWAALLLPVALAAGGCAAYTLKTPDPGPQAHVLTGVPVPSFGVQSCGPGSLSAVLGYHGEPVTLEDLETALPKGRNSGVLTLDLVLEARRRGYDARMVEGSPELVQRELLEGRPVILMIEVLNAPGERRDLFHYLVADGVEPSKGLLRIHLGDGKPRWTTFERLDHGWRSTRRTTLLITPGSPDARAAAAQNALRYAVALEAAGRTGEAISLYRGLLEDDPRSVLLWTNLGNAEAGRGETVAAEVAYRRALELDPANADALNNLAWLLRDRTESLAEAEGLARRAVAARGPDPHLALDTLGRVLRARGRCGEAIEVFTKALDSAPAATDGREWLTLEKGLALRDCNDPAARRTLEELAAAAQDSEVLERAREALEGARSEEHEEVEDIQTEPTAADFQMPATAFADVAEVSTRALAVDDGRAQEGATPPEITALRQAGLASAAQYRYQIGGERPGRFKVRVDVFRDEATAIAQFRGRHLPQALAMTEPFAAGDDGFIYRDQYAGFRAGPVTVEIRAEGASGRLPDFARSYAGFVTARLRGTRPGTESLPPAALPAADSRPPEGQQRRRQ